MNIGLAAPINSVAMYSKPKVLTHHTKLLLPVLEGSISLIRNIISVFYPLNCNSYSTCCILPHSIGFEIWVHKILTIK